MQSHHHLTLRLEGWATCLAAAHRSRRALGALLRMRWGLLPMMLLTSFAAVAQGPSEPRITCDRGPFGTKTYGGTAWELYGCSDNRSIAIVTARGNPAMPFYFLFAERNGQYQLSGEGNGRPEFTRLAYDDLRRLSEQDIRALVKETQKAGPRATQ
jgi:YD repeat-containing protein